MGLFGKKDKKRVQEQQRFEELPELPELPPLVSENQIQQELPRLPSFPNDSFGNKFSQDVIKEAVSDNEFSMIGQDSAPRNSKVRKMMDMAQFPEEPIRRSLTREISEEIPPVEEFLPPEFMVAPERARKAEPLFVRIDKVEDSAKSLQNIKEKIHQIEKTLKDIKLVKQQEEQELVDWENQMQTIKSQLDKIDNQIFSKIE